MSGCAKIGTANANTADQVGILARADWKVREELESIGRNEAAKLGGNAIVPTGPMAGGRQSFDVYRCADR